MTVHGLTKAVASNLASLADKAVFRQTDHLSPLGEPNRFTRMAVPQSDPFPNTDTPAVMTRRLSAGVAQTVTVLLTPATLIVNSGLTATITATVVDAGNIPVSGAVLSGSLLPASLGDVNLPNPTDSNGEAVGIWIPSAFVGSGMLSVTDGNVTGTAEVTLTVGSLTAIAVSPNPATVTAGQALAFSASGYDQYSNPIAVNPSWAVDVGSVIDANGVLTANTTAQSNVLVQATQNAVTGTALVNIAAGPLTRITVSPNPVTMTVDTTQTFTANGFDRYNNPVVITPTWTTNSLGSTIDAKAVFTASTSVQSGRLVTATEGAISGTTVVNLVPGEPAVLTISPASRTVNAGTSVTYTAIASDTFGNALGSVTASTVFGISPAVGGIFVGNAITPTVKNSYLITGVYGSLVATATLSVIPASYARLSIEDAQAGSGNPIGATILSIYQSLTAYAVRYDQYNNLLGAQPATWGATGVLSGTPSPTSGVSTTLTPMAVLSGTGVITATSGGITATTGLITVQSPVLKISKTDTPDPVTPGDILQYTIIYTNVGNADAQNVVVTETYPLSTSYYSGFSGTPPTIGDNVWQIGNLAAGSSGAIVVYVKVANQFPVSSVLTNTVRIDGSKVTSAVYTATTVVNAVPNVNVALSDLSDPVRVDDAFTYVIQYSNNGTAFVTGVRVTNTFPSQVSFVSATPPPDLHDAGYSYGVWLTNTLGAGQSRFVFITVRVKSPINDLTQLNDRVAISTNETGVYTTTESTLVESPILALTQSASPNSPTANSPVTYTLEYANTGSTYASNVIITDAIPINTTLADCGGCTGPLGGIVTWNLAQVPGQDDELLTLILNVKNNLPNGTLLTNTARISSTENVSAFTRLTATIVSAPVLALTLSDGISSAAANQVLTYSLKYTNSGTAPTQNVVVTEHIPSNVSVLSCLPTCVVMGGGVYSFTLNTVDAGASQAVTLTGKVNPTLPAGLRAITATAAIQTTTPGDDPANNFAQDVDAISTVPRLALGVGFDSTTPYEAKVITYTVRYTNTSAMDTTGVVLTVNPSTFVTNWSMNGTDPTIAIGDLPALASGIVTYVASLPITFTQAMLEFVTVFTINDDGPGGLPVASAVSAATIGVPDLVIDSVNLSPSTVAAGQKFTATATIRNQGTGWACNPKKLECITGAITQSIGGTFLDAFIDPPVPPPSYPYISDGNVFGIVGRLGPGLTTTVVLTNLVFATNQSPVLYFKIDNFDCNSGCLPSSGKRGLIPESDEYNNGFGPVPNRPLKIYLPLIRK